MLFDSHAHLERRCFGDDLSAVVRRALEGGLSGIVTIGASADPDTMREAIDLSLAHERIHAAIGVHPHEADRATEDTYESLRRFLREKTVVAIGETGLDYHYGLSSRAGQCKSFERQVRIACEERKPLVIHCRDAEDDCIAMLRGLQLPSPPGVLHCFTGDLASARRWLDLGFLLSIPGVVTFRKGAEGLRETVRAIPLDRMLVETDAPYLAPEPMRGKGPNEPAYIKYTVEAIATLKGLTPEDVARVTALNARRLFRISDPEAERPKLAYPIRDSLYLNVTNRCTLRCTFCPKWRDWYVKGHNLRLGRDPTVEELAAAMNAAGLERFREVVFCGYGEPLLRPEVVKALAAIAKRIGIRTRVNTDGLANMVHARDVASELSGVIDAVSVSLNAPDRATYARLCPSRFGEAAFDAGCDFIRRCREVIPEVVATVVALPGLDIEACRRLTRDVLGVALRVRAFDEVG